ncbi:DUF4123 domain-containing protein [Pyxidicoccus fallax]|uniref:DUF4123 domain-containing protein n=1 Tax=Pyxidicoccus fallax TaxID=394095 RepID=A0A848LH64_9BACT|nr:DUF4123 domain-containing protein [Pyxidicoccus fallax]NMO16995.1 DUF4123 domain-containing protein [Pyxidicoccus fallax]NPC84456.1 DUF4123 domain-containing protein [Pyxidicoccus fallax]
MSPPRRTELPRLLQAEAAHRPGLHLYGIFDGARDPRIHRRVLDSRFPQACLYAGKLPLPLLEVAPYLVRLDAMHPLAVSLLDEAWGRSWGIFFTSTQGLEPLRRHFRKFLKVRDERGKTLVFRYYDPRVLRVWLPTCNAAELDLFFEGIHRFHAESEAVDALLAFSREGAGLACETLRLAG